MSMIANVRSWLSWHHWDSGGGQLLWEGIAETADNLSDWMRAALASRFPSLAPADALQEIAYNQNLAPPALATATMRRYLANPWTKWAAAGTRGRLTDSATLFGELALLGFTSVAIYSWRNLADDGNPGAFGGDTSCWYLRINQPNPYGPPVAWDDGTLWDAVPSAAVCWDMTGDPEALARAAAAIDKWKPAASSCRFIEVELTDASIVRIPVHEWWEYDAAGNAADYYNFSY